MAFPPGKGKGNQWAQALRSRGTSDKRRQDPDAMDVDSMVLREEERRKLSKEGRCFHCKKQGHLLRECPDCRKTPKQREYENKVGGSSTSQREAPPKYKRTREVRAKEEEALMDKEPEKKALHDIKGLSKEQWAKLLTDLMAIDDEDF